VVDPQGVLWADYPVAKESLGHSFAERDYFRGLARTWTPYVSEVFRRQADPKALVVAVAVPIRSSDQKVLGGLVYQIRLEQLSRRIAQMHVGGSGYVVVLDHEGRVVAHPKLDLQAAIYGDYAPLEPTQNAMVGKESTVHYTDPLANRAMVASFVPVAVGQNHWVVIAQQPADEAYAPLRRLRWQLIVATGIIAVATLAVVLGLGHTRRQLRLTNRSLLAEIGEHKIAEDAVKKEQDSLRQLLDVYERHRQLAAFEIHDGLAQPLAAALMNFESLKHACAQDSAASGERFAATLQLLRDSMAEARRLMTGLRPPILDDFGVIAAIDHLVEECRDDGNVEIEWSHETKFNRLAAPLETALYRIVQEGLSNALRHSNSRRVGIRLTQRDGLIHAEIEDWGQGFDPGRVPQDRFGLQGIRERAKVFGGRAVIDSAPGRGTRIAVVLPVIERVATEVDDALEADDE
jgi:signal transduction histidine kinase